MMGATRLSKPRFHHPLIIVEELPNRELRALKARGQLLKPMLKVGKEGLSAAFLKAADETIGHQELVKVKFDEFKDQRKELTRQLGERLAAHVVMQVGHVVVLFRRKPRTEPAEQE